MLRKMGLEETAAATTIMADANKIQKGKNENSVINGKNPSMERMDQSDVYHALFSELLVVT